MSWTVGFLEGGGLDQDSLMVDESNMPINFEVEREFEIKEGP